MVATMVLLSLLAACASCIQLPNVNDDERTDSASPDSGDTDSGAIVDTGPPAKCDVELFDDDNFNDDFQNPVLVPMEALVCSTFDGGLDYEVLQFTSQQGGWIRVDVQAASRGSSADVHLTVAPANDESAACGQYSALSTTDPSLTWLAPSENTYLATLREEEYGYGEKYGWWMLASEVKSPVGYTRTEDTNAHDTLETALPLAEGETILAWTKTTGGQDFYRIELDEGDNHLVVDTNAAEFGSATNTKVDLYKVRPNGACDALSVGLACDASEDGADAGGTCSSTPYGYECIDWMWTDSEGLEGWNTDSYVDTEVTKSPRVMYLEVSDQGSGCADDFMWYTLSFSTEYKDFSEEE